MGDVYRAVDVRFGRPVAIKHLPQPFAGERFRREAEAIARLSHPAIVQVFDVTEDESGGWIVMELVEGRQLSVLIADGPPDLVAALPVFEDLAEALAEAHAKGILHRDLKTDNVMVTPAGRAKLLDFGLARWLDPEDHKLTLDGQIIGTPHAMSPEQAMSLDLDHRSDLFSLGTLFYETLTGVRPFHGAGIVETIRKVCVERQRPVHELNPGVPRELSVLVDRLLEKESENRPRNAGETAREIRRLAQPGNGESRLSAPRSVPETGRSVDPAPSSERRTITVAYCELACSGPRSGALDPEELLAVRPELQRIAARATTRFEGEIGESLDQGLRLFFGHPRTHRDDARRAVYAAREIVAGFEGLVGAAGEGLVAESGAELGIRVGIHTGSVAIPGANGRAAARTLAVGETGNLAAVLQGLASPGEILLSAATRKVVDPFFITEAKPPKRVPGFTEPIESYRWVQEVAPRKQ